MSKIPLKIVVAGRTYPLSVNEGEQRKVLKAAEDINNSIKLLQENYAVKDMQDLLAMTALQLATKSTNNQQLEPDFSEIEESLANLLKEINS
jgi:cell division protein ZapA